jgi:hypothetical protein
MKKTHVFLPFLLIALSACNEVPREAFFNRGDPESLLDVSSEVVSVQLVSEQSMDEIVDWIDQDQPTRADLLCDEADPLCRAAREVLEVYGIDYRNAPSGENAVHLVYERVMARDCEHRYIDNHINPYNMSHPAFGCSLASNMVRSVTDKRQFINPPLLDYYDAERGVHVYENGYLRAPLGKLEDDGDTSVSDASTD